MTSIYTVTNTSTGATMLVEASTPLQACTMARRATRPEFEARVATQAELLAAQAGDVLRQSVEEARSAVDAAAEQPD
jgi:hypothetical protein